MNKTITFLTIVLFSVSTNISAQTADFEWAISNGGSSADEAFAIATDDNGNVYTTGSFSGTADFDPGSGTANLTALGDLDMFVQKLNASGNLVWAKQMGGTDTEEGLSIAVDSDGNVITTGYFSGTVDFDPGSGVANLTSLGAVDIFVSKLDPNGDFIWVKHMGGAGANYGRGVTTDALGNIYTVGEFKESVDFNPNGSTNFLYSFGSANMFIQKLAANGNYGWTKQIGGAASTFGFAIDVNLGGDILTTGSFFGTSDFDPGSGTVNLTSTGSGDAFVLKLTANGDYVWAKQMNGSAYLVGNGIVTDDAENVLTVGTFEQTVDFNPGASAANLTSFGGRDVFIQKLDASGNYVWGKQLGGSQNDEGNGIAVDGLGNCYVTGFFRGTADFDPGLGTDNFTSLGFADCYISKLEANGDYVWSKQIGGDDEDKGNGVAIDSDGNIYTTGFFGLTVDFNPDAGVQNLIAAGNIDAFILKMSQTDNTSVSENSFDTYVTLYPNPTNSDFTIDLGATYTGIEVIISDLNGKVIQSATFDQTHLIQLSLGQDPGLYIVDIQVGSKLARLKMIKE